MSVNFIKRGMPVIIKKLISLIVHICCWKMGWVGGLGGTVAGKYNNKVPNKLPVAACNLPTFNVGKAYMMCG